MKVAFWSTTIITACLVWKMTADSCQFQQFSNLRTQQITQNMRKRNTRPPKTQTGKTWSTSSANYRKDCPKEEIIVPLGFRTKFYLIKKLLNFKISFGMSNKSIRKLLLRTKGFLKNLNFILKQTLLFIIFSCP